MGRGVRRAFDVVAACVVAGLIAIQIMGPASSAPAAAPRETYTHVDIVVDAQGVTVDPTVVPAGQIEFALDDRRPNPANPVTVQAVQVPGLMLHAGTSLWTQRALHSQIDLVATAGGARIGSGHINMVVPDLATPAAPDGARRITVALSSHGIMTPYREARFDQPVLPFSAAATPDGGVPWTTAVPGSVSLMIRNRTAASERCALDDGSRAVTIKRGHNGRVAATLRAGGAAATNFYSLTCAGGGGTMRLDFWMI